MIRAVRDVAVSWVCVMAVCVRVVGVLLVCAVRARVSAGVWVGAQTDEAQRSPLGSAVLELHVRERAGQTAVSDVSSRPQTIRVARGRSKLFC